jgi:hypothetical protein
MKYIYIIIIALSIGLQSFGQFKKGAFQPIQKNDPDNSAHYHLNVGTQFWAGSKNFYGNTNFISPSVNFDVTKRLSFTGGIGVAYTTMKAPLIINNEFKSGQQQSITSLFGYASGNYILNERLNFRGTLLLQQDQVGLSSQYQQQYQYKDILVGFDYKVAPGFTFSAQMGFSNRPGYSPLMMNHAYNDNWNNNYFLFTEPGF